MSESSRTRAPRLDWLDPLRALALLGVMFNHLVEAFGPGAWFTNPSSDWPDRASRIANFLPSSGPALQRLIVWLGWLGDSAPGMFLILSGLALAWRDRFAGGPGERPREFFTRRLLRIFPAYVAAHFVLLGLALFVAGNEDSFRGIASLLSLAGVRATPGTFFTINPSWWFVGTIIQLYLLYPWLRRARAHFGDFTFLAGAIGITAIWRGVGLLLLAPSFSLYAWLTGTVCLSRLAEFSVGMVLAHRLSETGSLSKSRSTVVVIGAGSLAGGLAASLFLPTVIVSNLLVSVGLVGIGLALVQTLPVQGRLPHMLAWIGAGSFGAFLLHQPLITWAAQIVSRNVAIPLAILLAAVTIVIGGRFERLSTALLDWIVSLRGSGRRRALAVGWLVFGLALCWSMASSSPIAIRALAWLLALCAVLAFLLLLSLRDERPLPATSALALFGASTVALAGAFPAVSIVLLLGAVAALVIALVTAHFRIGLFGSVAAQGIGAVVCCVAVERGLGRWAPLEAGRWGELPSLEQHPSRIYALRRSARVELHYNRYHYTVETDSLGFRIPPRSTGPATAPLVLLTGDAFAMGEGTDADATYAARLANTLAPCGVRVRNAGVTGYGPNEEAPQVAELVPSLRPALVVHEFFVNDFEEILLTPEARLRDVGFLAPRTRYERLDRLQLIAWQSRLGRATRETWGQTDSSSLAKFAFLRFYERGSNGPYLSETLDTMRRFLSRTDSITAASGARLLIAGVPAAVAVVPADSLGYIPTRFDSRYYDWARPVTELRQLLPSRATFVDLRPALQAVTGISPYYRTSWHWTNAGHQAVADTLAKEIMHALGLPLACLVLGSSGGAR